MLSDLAIAAGEGGRSRRMRPQGGPEHPGSRGRKRKAEDIAFPIGPRA